MFHACVYRLPILRNSETNFCITYYTMFTNVCNLGSLLEMKAVELHERREVLRNLREYSTVREMEANNR
jgi:hypothetical protein